MPRGRALSDDSRWIILQMTATMDLDTITFHTGVKKRTIQRILSDFKHHGTANRKQVPSELCGAPRVLSNENVGVSSLLHIYHTFYYRLLQFLQGSIRHTPDAYLDELKEALQEWTGVSASQSTIWRILTASGFTMKKVSLCHNPKCCHPGNQVDQISKNALEQNEALRARYCLEFGLRYAAEQAVFVDESSFDRRTDIRGRAWALSGRAAIRKAFFVRGKRYVLCPLIFVLDSSWVLPDTLFYLRSLCPASFTRRLSRIHTPPSYSWIFCKVCSPR